MTDTTFFSYVEIVVLRLAVYLFILLALLGFPLPLFILLAGLGLLGALVRHLFGHAPACLKGI